MELFTTERARLAANTLLAVEISFGALAFWFHAFEKGDAANFVVAALLTAFFGSLSLLASGVVTRVVAAGETEAPVTLALAAFCGVVLAMVGGFMTWHGLVWADSVAELLPGDAHDHLLIVGAGLLSVLNLVAIYVFCRELKPASHVTRLEDPKTVAGRVLAMERHGKKTA